MKNKPVTFGKELPKRRRLKMISEKRTVDISKSNIDAQIAVLLYATGHAHDNDDIVINAVGKVNKEGLVPITFTVYKQGGDSSKTTH